MPSRVYPVPVRIRTRIQLRSTAERARIANSLVETLGA
jgi:hypothetical protein